MDKLTQHLSAKFSLGDTKSEDISAEVKELLQKFSRFQRINANKYKNTIDKAVVRDFINEVI